MRKNQNYMQRNISSQRHNYPKFIHYLQELGVVETWSDEDSSLFEVNSIQKVNLCIIAQRDELSHGESSSYYKLEKYNKFLLKVMIDGQV